MSDFERYLAIWVGLCIVAGIALGQFMPSAFAAISALEIAKVNLPVAILVWLMIVPMLMKIVNASKDWYERSPAVIRNGGESPWTK